MVATVLPLARRGEYRSPRERLLAVGVEEGFCSGEFLEPVWGERTEKAARVCACESSGNPRAVSRDRLYYGLFQVDPNVHDLRRGDLFDPIFNSVFSAALQSREGWEPWPVCGRL
ncbi:MAG: hypothetical protein WEB00_06535 [Dehalococcoidia bacterium]